MKRVRTITCTNQSNISVTFGEKKDSPFIVEDADGLYSMNVDLSISDNAMMDGGTYQSGWLKTRNIVLTLRDRGADDHIDNRQLLFSLFPQREKGTLIIADTEGPITVRRMIDYYVESVISDGTNYSRMYSVSLICPDPYFYDVAVSNVQMAAWISAFQFQHQFAAAGEEIGYRSKTKSQDIENNVGSDAVGMTITILASGQVKNPSIARAESGERIKIGTDSKAFTMEAGDILTITTGVNNKHVYLTHEGVKTEVNQYLSADSKFITLHHGHNTIGYDADGGVDFISAEISYRMRYTSA